MIPRFVRACNPTRRGIEGTIVGFMNEAEKQAQAEWQAKRPAEVPITPVDPAAVDPPRKRETTTSEQWQKQDVDWLIQESGRVELREDAASDIMVRMDSGVWQLLVLHRQKVDRSTVLTALQESAPHRRPDNVDLADQPPTSARHLQQVISKMADEQNWMKRMPASRYNATQTGTKAVLPLSTGGAIEIATGKVVTPAELAELRVSCSWKVAPPMTDDGIDPRINDAGEKIAREILTPGHPLYSLLEAVAFGMVTTFKSVTAFKWDVSNTGKSMLIEMINKEVSSAVHHIQGLKKLSTNGDFNSELGEPLSESLVLVLDDVGKGKLAFIHPMDLESMVATYVRVHKKYFDPVSLMRIAAVIMMGNDWPDFPFGITGLVGSGDHTQRADYAPIFVDPENYPQDDVPGYTTADFKTLEASAKGRNFIRELLLEKAGEYARQIDAGLLKGESVTLYDVAHKETKRRIDKGRLELRWMHDEVVSKLKAGKASGGDRYNSVIERLEYTGNKADLVFYHDLAAEIGITEMPHSFKKDLTKAKTEYTALGNGIYKSESKKVKDVSRRFLRGWKLNAEASDDIDEAVQTLGIKHVVTAEPEQGTLI